MKGDRIRLNTWRALLEDNSPFEGRTPPPTHRTALNQIILGEYFKQILQISSSEVQALHDYKSD